MEKREFPIMNNYCTVKQIIFVLILIQMAPPLSAFGYAKCFFAYKNPQYANCIGQRIVHLTTAVHPLPNKTQWLNVSQNAIAIVEHKTFSHLPNLLDLRLNKNQIRTVQSGAFKNLKNLLFLDLSENLIQSLDNWDMTDLIELRILNISHNNISTIHSMSLTPLYHLQELDLSFNKITNFAPVAEAIKNLAEISKLNLSSNGLANLDTAHSVIAMHSLNILDLRNNSIGHLDLSYLYMPNLTVLTLMKNGLSIINISTFSNVPKLKKIIFDENPLNMNSLLGIQLPELTELHWSSMRPALDDHLFIPCQVFQSLPKLRELYIMHSKVSHNKLRKIGECTNLTSLFLTTTALRALGKEDLNIFKHIKVLYLNKCKIAQIDYSTWTDLKSLNTLILERNQIAHLRERLFSPLTDLQYLDLSKNYFTLINNRSLIGLKKLETLILRNCKIVTIASYDFNTVQNLKFLDLRENSISIIKRKAFYNLQKLETLLLSENQIHAVQSYCFRELKSLKTLVLANNKIYRISDNTFYSLKTLIFLNMSRNEVSFPKRDTQNPFKKLPHLETLDMSYQTQRYKDQVSLTLFQGLQSLKTLYVQGISSSFFKDVSFSFLPNLTDFDMSGTFHGSDINTTVELIRKCSQVRYLNVDNNELTDLPEDLFVKFNLLENLSLKYNKLRNISKNLVKPLSNLRNLDLYMNPLLCSCDNYWFQNWSRANTQVQIPFLQSYTCFAQAVHDINFLNQDLSFCGTDISALFFIATFTLTFLFLVISLVTVRLKWSILYSYHMMKVWFQYKVQREKRLYKYDAYISYCSEDEHWVVKELLFHLEKEGQRKYKLCFKPRDFMPGSYHIDNIQDAIRNSRKTLCVVSTGYLESQWCKIEAEIACSRVFYEKEDVLLVVFLEEIPDFRLSAYHKLRKLIKQNTYINWPEDPEGDEFFWFKLRKALDAGAYEEDTVQLAMAN
ncbi:toll-like receptor 13 [Dendropsophus ebraccatus]|uniref:toll-like receptor 13 n=1 Tax=Dendropsophus ebraccatus TaxID=150705 RepID=UPI0038312EC6